MTIHDPKMPAQRPHEVGRTPQPSDTDKPSGPPVAPAEHEGADETEVGDRTGPGAGYDDEPEQEKDPGGVS